MRLHAVCSKHPIARIPCGVKVNYKIKGSVFNACESGGRESGGRESRATDFGAGEALSGGRQSRGRESGGRESGGRESRATDFGADEALACPLEKI